MAKGVKDLKGLKDQVIHINQELNGLRNNLKVLRDNISGMMKGDAEGPYWNGEAASEFYAVAIKNMNANIADYNRAYKQLSALGTSYEETKAASKAKGKK